MEMFVSGASSLRSIAAPPSIPNRPAQVQSAVIFGISAALFGEITLKGGRVEQTNSTPTRFLRMNQAPH